MVLVAALAVVPGCEPLDESGTGGLEAGAADAALGDGGGGAVGRDAAGRDAAGRDSGHHDLGTADASMGDADREGADARIHPADGAAGDAVRPDPAVSISVDNVADGETLRFELALLAGTVSGPVDSITLQRGDLRQAWPVVGGHFKALVPLVVGDNRITLSAGAITHTHVLSYAPPTTHRRVRLVWYVPSDHDGGFIGPPDEPRDLESALARLRFGGLLMQTLTAEAMHAQGFGRRTFALSREAGGAVEVLVHRSRSLTTEAARQMDGVALWIHIWEELAGTPDLIDVVLLSATDYDRAARQPRAHTALGGDRLGLFGSGTLHTWAQGLDEMVERFADERRINAAELFDDSAGRRTHWANYATGLGATLHELGHCLTLPHPSNRVGIMARAFDHVNRNVMAFEPPSALGGALSPVRPEDETGWDRSAAVRLRYLRWLDADPRDTRHGPPVVSRRDGGVHLQAAAGLRHVAYHFDGEVIAHDEHLGPSPPTELTFTRAQLDAQIPAGPNRAMAVMDDEGNLVEFELAD